MKSVTRVQILVEAVYLSLQANRLGKLIYPNILLPAIGKY